MSPLEEGISIARQECDSSALSYAYNAAGNMQWQLHNIRKAAEYFRAGIEIVKSHGYVRNRAVVMRKLGWVLTDLGLQEEALECFAESLNTYILLGDWKSRVVLLYDIGICEQRFGRYSHAENYLAESHNLSMEHKEEFLLTLLEVVTLQLYGHQQRFEDARKMYLQIHNLDRYSQSEEAAIQILETMGGVELLAGNISSAQQYFSEVDKLKTNQQNSSPGVNPDRVSLLLMKGLSKDAFTMIFNRLLSLDYTNPPWEKAVLYELLSEVYIFEKNWKQASALLGLARFERGSMGYNAPYSWQNRVHASEQTILEVLDQETFEECLKQCTNMDGDSVDKFIHSIAGG